MYPKKAVALLLSILVGVGAACSDGTDAATSDATASASTAIDGATTVADTVDTATATASDTATATDDAQAEGGGGPGGGVSVGSVASVDEMVALIQEAYGDASLGLHRGHQDVESTLIEVLGMTHDEMHVRMETQGQGLAAIATDIGIEPQDVIDALVATRTPAIDNLLAAGTITEAEADAYLVALQDAYTYRVNWNGEDATPTFTGI